MWLAHLLFEVIEHFWCGLNQIIVYTYSNTQMLKVNMICLMEDLMVTSAVRCSTGKSQTSLSDHQQQTSKFQQPHCLQSHHTIMEDFQVNLCCDWLSTVKKKWKRYLIGRWEFSQKLCSNLWKCKLPSCCQPTAIHLTQEAGSFTLAATCTRMMQGRPLFSSQKASLLASRAFAFLAIIFIAISEANYTALQGNEGKPQQRSSES